MLLPPKLGPDLLQTLKATSPSAGSLDGWLPADFAFLHDSDARYLAPHALEAGSPWPVAATQGRTATSLQDDSATHLLDFRLLSLLGSLCRRWATHRLRQVQEWASTWAPSGTFAGVTGRGADDCWWLFALDVEEAKLLGHDVFG